MNHPAPDRTRPATQNVSWSGARPWAIALGVFYRTLLMLLAIDLLATLAFGPLSLAGHALALATGILFFYTLLKARSARHRSEL